MYLTIFGGGDLLLFEAVHTHPASMCPMLTSEGKAQLKKMFSEENMKMGGVKLATAYLSCTSEAGPDHHGYFTVEAENADSVKKFFGPMAVDMKPVQPFNEIAKML